jgi:hypothetical protein
MDEGKVQSALDVLHTAYTTSSSQDFSDTFTQLSHHHNDLAVKWSSTVYRILFLLHRKPPTIKRLRQLLAQQITTTFRIPIRVLRDALQRVIDDAIKWEELATLLFERRVTRSSFATHKISLTSLKYVNMISVNPKEFS